MGSSDRDARSEAGDGSAAVRETTVCRTSVRAAWSRKGYRSGCLVNEAGSMFAKVVAGNELHSPANVPIGTARDGSLSLNTVTRPGTHGAVRQQARCRIELSFTGLEGCT